jgi:aquaporin Z
MKQWQKYVAEVLGTFVLVLVGSLAILGTRTGIESGTQVPPVLSTVAIGFAFGLALLAGLYAFGEVSGGHFNPIVSLSMFLDRRLTALETVWYWISQFVGAICASLVVLAAFASSDDVARTGTSTTAEWRGFVLELVASAIFVAVILQVTRSDRYGSTTLVAIPLTLTAIHFALVPLTGCSVNPARSFGPALVGGSGTLWGDIWIYLIAPPIGAIVGWAAHMIVVRGDMSLGDDLARAATDMRSVEMDDLRQGPGQVPPPEPPPASTPEA